MLSFDDRDGLIWFDGALVPWQEARLHVMTHSLHAGGAVFEGIRAYDGKIFRAHDHIARLQRSAEILGYRLPNAALELVKACEAVIWANELGDAYLRPIAWRGSESVTVAASNATIHVAIAAWDWPTPPDRGESAAGMRLALSCWRRPRADTAPTASKCSGLYMIGTLARHAANAQGFDDALLLDLDGHVAETTAANIVMVTGGTLVSPRADCFLDSITKRHVFELARQGGLAVEERTVSLKELCAADEVFVVGTAVEIRPVIELAGPELQARWSVGPCTRGLVAAFHASVRGKDPVQAQGCLVEAE
ncbi:branched-chain amino acid aminotransferase [Hoeflea olei]|uniref:Branched-chain-amino-acid aminotransferase n=2 Tax=Hoeflea olei TaxID=1480615 RepID=A0A1C1Z1W6_9HYPH|nr:branched-chain amino acid aminotransferase [Hoeflea olei]